MTLAAAAFLFSWSIFGSFVQTVSGFGYGVLTMAILPYFVPYAQATAVCSMCGGTLSAMVALRCRDKIDYKLMWPMLAGHIVASTGAIWFSVGQSKETLMRLLGLALIGLSVYFLFFNDRLRIRPTRLNGVVAGALGGIGGGLFAIGGPPVVVYLLSATCDKETYRATIQAYFAISSVVLFVARLQSGIIDGYVVQLWALALAALAAGVWLGNLFFRRISPTVLRRSVYAMMAVSGIVMLL